REPLALVVDSVGEMVVEMGFRLLPVKTGVATCCRDEVPIGLRSATDLQQRAAPFLQPGTEMPEYGRHLHVHEGSNDEAQFAEQGMTGGIVGDRGEPLAVNLVRHGFGTCGIDFAKTKN